MQETSVVATLQALDGGGDRVGRGEVVHYHHSITGRLDHVDEDFYSVLARQTVEEHSRAHDVERSARLA